MLGLLLCNMSNTDFVSIPLSGPQYVDKVLIECWGGGCDVLELNGTVYWSMEDTLLEGNSIQNASTYIDATSSRSHLTSTGQPDYWLFDGIINVPATTGRFGE